jgi:Plasmid encoded RepA protein
MSKRESYKGVLIPRLIEAGQEIDDNPDDVISYQHGLFCQLSLPRSKADGLTCERHYRGASVKIRAGELWNGREWVQQPLPYGVHPRLILAHINTEAVQRRTRFIDLEGSAARFMERIGVRSFGRDFYTFRQQMKAIAAAQFLMGYTDIHGRDTTLQTQPVKRFAGWTTTQDGQGALWPAEMELSQDYYDDLLKHAVPLDARAMIALKHSALAIDAYSFLAKRLHTLTRPTRIAYAHFHEQFGQEYKSLKDFSREWKKAVATAKFVYPMAKITPTKGGLILEPSPPPITGQPPKLVK